VKPEQVPLTKSQRKKAAEEARNEAKQRNGRVVKLILVAWLACLIFLPLGILIGYLSITSELREIAEVKLTAVPTPQPKPDNFVPDLGHLVTLSPGQLEGTDIAAMNLACAQGLPGTENMDVFTALQTLDVWTSHVREETERNFHRFTENPAQFHNSVSWWRAAMMITVLQQDCGVHYNLQRMQDMSMTHAEDIFIPGLVSSLREGTCSSMPILYIAIGRRLGYPLYLVTTRGHCFVRWESKDGKVRFNMEATGQGLSCHADDYYKVWPYTLTQDDLHSGIFLRNLTSAEELALFLELRGNVLDALPNRMPEAELAYAEAHALMPNNIEHFGWLVLSGGREDMATRGMLNPDNPKNPYRDKIPMPYSQLPPDSIATQAVLHDETAK
jgi:hypothetical protein